MRGLIVREPWASQIVEGQKPVEYRSRPTNIRGRIGIIAGGSGTVIGEVTLTDCRLPDDAEPEDYGWEWVLSNPIKYPQPRKYKHPNGAVVWVNLPD